MWSVAVAVFFPRFCCCCFLYFLFFSLTKRTSVALVFVVCFFEAHYKANRLPFKWGGCVCARASVDCAVFVCYSYSGVWCCSCSFLVSLWIHLPAWSFFCPFLYFPPLFSTPWNHLRVYPRRHSSWHLCKKFVCGARVCVCVCARLRDKKERKTKIGDLTCTSSKVFGNLMCSYKYVRRLKDSMRIWTLLFLFYLLLFF